MTAAQNDPAQADTELIGRTGKPFSFPIELGKVREFARAINSRNPEYRDGSTTPPTFLMASDHWQTRQNVAWGDHKPNLARMLHAEQEFTFHGPPPAAGTVLNAQSRIDKRYEKEGRRGGTMIFTEIVTEYRDSDDQLVAEARATLVETSKAAKK